MATACRPGANAAAAKREEATLFQHLLVPTDGWALSEGAVRVAVQRAKAIQAKLTGLHVIPEYRVFTHRIDMLEDTRERYAQLAEQHAEQYLGVIVQATEDASVACDHLRHQ